MTTGAAAPDGLEAVATRMAQAITHRGPDDAGAWADASCGVAFGHRRLSIVDLSPAGHQPMVSGGGRYVIAFNGEIYNHLSLRDELQAVGAAPAWRGHSDTETLLAGFEAWGIETTLQKTVGMFAIALWDRKDQVLTLARDRFGEKPLYYGSAGTWYLFDEVATCFAQLLRMRPDARFLIVNRGEHAYIRDRLAAAGVPDSAVELTSATHAEVPRLMARMDAGVFFIKPVFSMQASAPTKLAEFLGCGIPCLGNAGVGDMAEVLEGEQVGVALNAFDEASVVAGLAQLLALTADPGARARCVAAAQKHFSLDEGVRRYRAIYEQFDGVSNA
ncbi:MAG: hypothetical protein U1A73_14585 [Pseudomonas sp.]|nr:hypothetical protein [Pseudomonas sp.]